MLRAIAAIAAIAAVAAVAMSVTTPVAAAGSTLPSVTTIADAQAGGQNWWRVTFSNGTTCDVQRPLTETLTGSKPAIGAVRSYEDGRMFIAGTRMWGSLQFTDAGNTPRSCY